MKNTSQILSAHSWNPFARFSGLPHRLVIVICLCHMFLWRFLFISTAYAVLLQQGSEIYPSIPSRHLSLSVPNCFYKPALTQDGLSWYYFTISTKFHNVDQIMQILQFMQIMQFMQIIQISAPVGQSSRPVMYIGQSDFTI